MSAIYGRFDFADATGQPQALEFRQPLAIYQATTSAEVLPTIQAAQAAAQAGAYVIGYVSYEAAVAFDSALQSYPPAALPLVWFAAFAVPQVVEPTTQHYQLSPWQPTISLEHYRQAIAAIHAAIASGETYQVNYTLRLRATFNGDPLAFYHDLRAAQAANYCAYLNLGEYQILSASPELFFDWRDQRLTTKPMKGTAPRGRWPEEDQRLARQLLASEKNRAENLMIVDLLRNDLGRVAAIGSVGVPRLFELERYRTVWQLTSTVAAKTKPNTSLLDILQALFPCGSITGAPKVKTMELIRQFEADPRAVYCGAIGILRPDGSATFNVAIRTVWIDQQRQQAEYGVGGGITWDSQADDEYAEAQLKAQLLTERWPQFDLIETLRWDGQRYWLLEHHLRRLHDSAAYFGFAYDQSAVLNALNQHSFGHSTALRVRLNLTHTGDIAISSSPLTPTADGQKVSLAATAVNSQNRFLYHKTTNRRLYDEYTQQSPTDFDVLLWNEHGQLTEFTRGNLVLELDGQRWTPPVEVGLLAGTYRAELLQQRAIQERTLVLADLWAASKIWLINSVRGWVLVELATTEVTISCQ
ncbi:aminodeoxychorismate synthase component I [Herpetosiphon sp.]|uniref:Para-aminobenzoate synthase, subunit I n=1 Tax=Herpetosiphon aurantiacus (strain ATCC 23779 / DSM 785 / 114-95) TaxID=316274 RepID=A9B3Q5_HERA2|nr:aminodeoxychorismate synthase component I [Herpetosiphon sp.]ABX05627.1 para-aminobenzoate synthase, subunit I [Herpetosiphon aurantiacus DSM 785]